MFSNEVKNILIECLNENILVEGYAYSNNYLIEGGSGSTMGQSPNSAVGAGSPGSGLVVKAKPYDSSSGATAGISEQDIIDTYGSDVLNLLGLGAGFFIGSPGKKGSGGIDLSSIENKIGGIQGKMAASFIGNNLSRLMGVNHVIANLMNIVPKQEALRREGLGYTEGWAKMDTLEDIFRPKREKQ